MYPLKVIVIGCDDDLLPHVRRELANQSVRVEAEAPDAGSVIAALRPTQGDKRLLILHMKSTREVEDLKRLVAAFAGWPVLALIDAGGKQADFSEMILGAMRAGAGQVVPLPLHAEDFKTAMDCFASQVVYAARDKKVIAVAGVTGGCGGTTLAVNLAYEIAHLLDRRCILADLSLTMGMVAASLNVEPRYTMQDLLADVRRVDVDLVRRVLFKVTDNLQILAGPHKIIAPPPNPPQDVLQVVHILKQLADVVVLDVSCTYNDLYFEVLANASQVVLVCEQTVPSIRALKLIREALGRADADDSEYLVINRYDPKVHGFTVADLAKLLQVPAWHPIDNDWAAVVASVNHGVPLRLEAPQSRALRDIDSLARTLLAVGDQPEVKTKDLGVFGRMRRAFTHT